MKKIILLLVITLSLSANQCQTAKVSYDASYNLYRKGIQEKQQCENLVKSLGIIKKECDFSDRTKKVIGLMRDRQQLECGLIKNKVPKTGL